ncbi:extracellular solute-binding protein [Microbacterium sp. bgisy207]|uniref:extracellular solute-binding protein n=1 Tax=Microbacterium sp. bgisy207 TaxID=3413800 RepID=UPI003EB8DE2F
MIDPSVADGAKGDVALCGNNDNGAFGLLVKSFNESQSAVTATYTALGPNSSETRQQAIQRLDSGNDDCDIYVADVVWTAEWAAQGWILDQSELVKEHADELIPSVVDSTTYDGRNWATPYFTNAGLLFYRDDRVSKPDTLQDLYDQAASNKDNAMLIALAPKEGLTTNFLEILYSAGGAVLDDQGNVVVDSDETRAVLDLMKGALDSGAIDRASLTYDDGAARTAFESGVGGFLRNWPNAYSSGLQAPAVQDVLKVTPAPAFDKDHPAQGVLGGGNLAIPVNTKNLAGAVALLNYAVSPEFQAQQFIQTAYAPVVDSVYDEADVQAAIPFADQLHSAVENAKSRPKSPVYAEISAAIYNNVYAALSGQSSTDDAIKKMVTDIQTAQDAF